MHTIPIVVCGTSTNFHVKFGVGSEIELSGADKVLEGRGGISYSVGDTVV